tara:strand:+ start:401 stop:574 length:174 start_codon:yes stop_codon:yes gene_type:complete
MIKTNYTKKELQLVRDFFTDDQWDAIEHALGDYQDYGDNEADLASQINDKMDKLFDL